MLNYSTAFRDVNGMFNNVASFINTSTAGGGDVFGQWMTDLSNYWNNNNGIQALWGLITGAFSGVLESLLLLVGYILFKFAPACLPAAYRDGLMERVNAVRRTQGIDRATLVNETAARIRAAAAE